MNLLSIFLQSLDSSRTHWDVLPTLPMNTFCPSLLQSRIYASVLEWDSLPIWGSWISTEQFVLQSILKSHLLLLYLHYDLISKQANVYICVTLFLTLELTQLTSARPKIKDNFINISHLIYLIKKSLGIKSEYIIISLIPNYLILAWVVDKIVNAICHHKQIII